MSTVCFLDLDGVLVDFVKGALDFHGKHLAPSEVRWNFPDQAGFAGDKAKEFWDPLGEEFWATLPWCAEGRELLAGVEKLFGASNVCLLTSPCATPGCAEGKLRWVKEHLPAYKRRVLVGPCKELLASPRHALVDDHDANVEGFRTRGGFAFLVPRPWNKRNWRCTSSGSFDVPAFLREVTLDR